MSNTLKTGWGETLNKDFFTRVLFITEHLHAQAEKRLPKHDWQVWYGAYIAGHINGYAEGASVMLADEAALREVAEQRAKADPLPPAKKRYELHFRSDGAYAGSFYGTLKEIQILAGKAGYNFRPSE